MDANKSTSASISSPPTLRAVRTKVRSLVNMPSWVVSCYLLLCILVTLNLLALLRRQWFILDEYDYYTSNDSSVGWLAQPHNEHTIFWTKLWFSTIYNNIGLRHYAIYGIPLIAAHLAVGLLMLVTVRKATGSNFLGLGASSAILFLGAGTGTLVWAGQMQVVGAIAAGMCVLLMAWTPPKSHAAIWIGLISIFGALSGSSFLSYALTASIILYKKRNCLLAIISSLPPVSIVFLNKIFGPEATYFGPTSLRGLLTDGIPFIYTSLQVPLDQTLLVPSLTGPFVAILALGIFKFVGEPDGPKTQAGQVLSSLTLGLTISILLLTLARLGRGPESLTSGGYSYMIMVYLLPISIGLLWNFSGKTQMTTRILLALLLLMSVTGAATQSRIGAGLSSWRLTGSEQLRTAAEIISEEPHFPLEPPSPEFAPTVTAEEVDEWVSEDRIDPAIVSEDLADIIRFNVQWQLNDNTTNSDELTCERITPGQVVILDPHAQYYINSTQKTIITLSDLSSEANKVAAMNTGAIISSYSGGDSLGIQSLSPTGANLSSSTNADLCSTR